MFFVISKVLFGIFAPSNFCLLLIGSGLACGLRQRWQQVGRRLAIAGFLLLLVVGFSPLGKWLSLPLENRFASVRPPAVEAVTHIILLGGFEDASISRWRGQITTNAAGERLLAIPMLARRYPKAKIVFTGGYGALFGTPADAASSVAAYLVAAGIARDRLLLEGKSRTTWENALYVKDLLAAEPSTCPCGFVLVTSSWHMPRSVGIFRKTGFDSGDRRLFPWPVDYRTRGGWHLWSPFGWLHDGLLVTDIAVKEWVGLVGYWLMGRTSQLWPGLRESRGEGAAKNSAQPG